VRSWSTWKTSATSMWRRCSVSVPFPGRRDGAGTTRVFPGSRSTWQAASSCRKGSSTGSGSSASMPTTGLRPRSSKRRQAPSLAIRNSETRKKPLSKRVSSARTDPSPTVRPRTRNSSVRLAKVSVTGRSRVAAASSERNSRGLRCARRSLSMVADLPRASAWPLRWVCAVRRGRPRTTARFDVAGPEPRPVRRQGEPAGARSRANMAVEARNPC